MAIVVVIPFLLLLLLLPGGENHAHKPTQGNFARQIHFFRLLFLLSSPCGRPSAQCFSHPRLQPGGWFLTLYLIFFRLSSFLRLVFRAIHGSPG